MEDFEKRMVDEYFALKDKCENLAKAVGKYTPFGIEEEELELMKKQLEGMQLYQDNLYDRIVLHGLKSEVQGHCTR